MLYSPTRDLVAHASGILGAIGGTPLVRLNRLFEAHPARVYGKLEFLNAGGSAKDRPARAMIEEGLKSGEINPDTTVVESSSGNMGIGLAQACSCYGLKFRCVVDPKTSPTNIQIMKAYGAELEIVVQPHPVTGEFLAARLDRVRELLQELPNAFWPNQYANKFNARAHYCSVAEILDVLDGCLDWIVVATSTCGTLRGYAEYLREHSPKTRILAVDAHGSVIFGSPSAKRLIPGHGASVSPPLFSGELCEANILVSDLDCVVGCRRLARREAILAGGSSGGIVTAFSRVSRELVAGSNCVLIFHDRGERYLGTIYSDEWVKSHFGEGVSWPEE